MLMGNVARNEIALLARKTTQRWLLVALFLRGAVYRFTNFVREYREATRYRWTFTRLAEVSTGKNLVWKNLESSTKLTLPSNGCVSC